MDKKLLTLTASVFVIGIMLALTVIAQQSAPSSSGVKMTVSPKVTAMAKNPAAPANAQQKTSVGKGSATMGTSNSSGDNDSYWVQEVDVDGDGDVETANFLWDDEDKALFIGYEDDFTCNNGATGSGDILIGLNAAGNPRKMPVGSGFYAVSLDESECNVAEAALWGCKFDADGNATACGVATIDEKTDTIVIAAVSE